MKRLKLFIENFLVYGLGGILSKLVPLIMLPVITRLMPDTAYFGINDLISTIISFGSSITIFGMYDAMFRLYFEKEDDVYKKSICSSALMSALFNATVVGAVLILFRKSIAELILGNSQYDQLIVLAAVSIFVGASNNIIAAPTRMQNKRKVYLFTNTFSAVAAYAITLLLLEYEQYLWALPLGTFISTAIIVIYFFGINRKWFKFKLFHFEYVKQLLKIGAPLVPNFLIYWVFNSSDRIMLTSLLGNEYTGIYAVGARVSHISYLVHTAFAGGWQYFAFSTMRDDDQVELTSNIFEYLGALASVAGMLMASLSYFLFKFFFEEDYVQGYIVAPWLFLAPLIQMLYQVIGNQFLVIKKTWPSMMILGSGALINIVINLYFIPLVGIEGAAIATLWGYLVAVIVAVIVLSRMKLVRISRRFGIILIVVNLFFIIWRIFLTKKTVLGLLWAITCSAILIYLYRKELSSLINNITSLKKIEK